MLYFQNRYWTSLRVQLSMALMYIWLKRAYISSFLCRSLAPTTRFSLFHRPELTAPIIRQMCQGTEKSAMILSVKLCSKNSCIAILSKCWRWPSTEYLTVCITRVFLGTALLNEADNPPSWLSRLWHVLGWFFLRGLNLSFCYIALLCQWRKHAITPYSQFITWGLKAKAIAQFSCAVKTADQAHFCPESLKSDVFTVFCLSGFSMTW